MDELVIPEIVFVSMEATCHTESCEAFETTLVIETTQGCTEITCGPCGQPITDLKEI